MVIFESTSTSLGPWSKTLPFEWDKVSLRFKHPDPLNETPWILNFFGQILFYVVQLVPEEKMLGSDLLVNINQNTK